MDINKLKELHNKLNNPNSGNSGYNADLYYKIQEGENLIRVLPGKDEEDAFFVEHHMHYVPDPTNPQKSRAYQCLKPKGEVCPICSLYGDLWNHHENVLGLTREDDSPQVKLARKLKPTIRYYINAYIRSEDKVKVVSIPKTVFERIVSSMIQIQDEAGANMLDPEAGYDFKLIKDKVPGKPWPSYNNSTHKMASTKLGNKATIAASLESMTDLDTLIKEDDQEELRSILIQHRAATLDRPVESSEQSEDDLAALYGGDE